MALAVSLVALGGVAAADGSTAPIEQTPTETPSGDGGDGGDVGICVVGADSPCNDDGSGENSQTSTTDDEQAEHSDADGGDAISGNDSGDGQMWIPEDQNRDGEIDDRFKSDDSDDNRSRDGGWCRVIDPPADEQHNAHRDPGMEKPRPEEAERSDSGNESGQIWIPEDQNRDGEIDDRFKGDSGNESSQIFLPEDQNRDGEIDDRFKSEPPEENENSESIGSDGDSDEQVWIPEDQNRDGEIDDRFTDLVLHSLIPLVSS
jgi:hypothetical protein